MRWRSLASMVLRLLGSTSASQRQDFEIFFTLLRIHPVRTDLVQRMSCPFSRLVITHHACALRWMPAGGKTIIFVDEIDALAPSREKGGAGGSELHNRIVATFLTLLDGVKPSAEEIGSLFCVCLSLLNTCLFSLSLSLPFERHSVYRHAMRWLSAEQCMLDR